MNTLMKVQFLSCLEGKFGIGQYSEQLAKKLYNDGLDISLSRKKGEKLSFTNHYPHRSLKNLRNHIAPYYLSKELNRQNEIPIIYHADNIDAFLGLHWSNKRNNQSKKIVTIHDVIPLHFKNKNPLIDSYYKYQLEIATTNADLIITVSDASKNDIVKFTNVSPNKVKVIYNGIDHSTFFCDKNRKVLNDVFTIRYLGGLGVEHKNAIGLIEVARILEEQKVKFKMQIGSGNAENTPLPALVKKYKLNSVEFVGYIPDEGIQEFLQGADAFLYPSLFEGFGFPPLEAMSCGTATVSSFDGSLGEVLEGGALLSSSDSYALAENMIELIRNPQLKTELEVKGMKVAQKYTWQKAANELKSIYEEII